VKILFNVSEHLNDYFNLSAAIPVGKIAKKQSEGVRFSAMLSKIHFYRPLFQRFCPLGCTSTEKLNIKISLHILRKVDVKKNMLWKPIFDVIVSDCALKSFVCGTRIPKSTLREEISSLIKISVSPQAPELPTTYLFILFSHCLHTCFTYYHPSPKLLHSVVVNNILLIIWLRNTIKLLYAQNSRLRGNIERAMKSVRYSVFVLSSFASVSPL